MYETETHTSTNRLSLGLCQECEKTEKKLPSIESFQQRYDRPRVYFLFYNCFLKGVIGNKKWKRNMNKNRKLGTSIVEAFAHCLLENNYFAWLFEYKE